MDAVVRIKGKMTELLKDKPIMFSDLMDLFDKENYRDILLSWGELREEGLLKMDQEGLYYLDK